MITECNLLDAYDALKPGKEFGTHINGSKRIDFILCSDNMLEFIDSIDYLPLRLIKTIICKGKDKRK
jgi:hypothetical protein